MPFVAQKRRKPKTVFGRNLTKNLDLLGWSYEKLAKKIGLSRVQVYRLAVGQREPRLDTIRRIAYAMLLEVPELLEE